MLNDKFRQEVELLQTGYRYALSLTHHLEDAEDLVQTACLKLYRKYGRLKHKMLLFRTIRYTFFDQCRRDNIIQFYPLEEKHMLDKDTHSESEFPITAAELELFLQNLRPQEREVLYLHVVEGYSARDIGKLTGYPRNTVLSLLHRGKQKLQRAITADSTQ